MTNETTVTAEEADQIALSLHREGNLTIAKRWEKLERVRAFIQQSAAKDQRIAELEGQIERFRSAAEDAIVALDRTKRQSSAIAGLYVLLDPVSERIESYRPFSFAEDEVVEEIERRARNAGGR